jgi:hypothetical protein
VPVARTLRRRRWPGLDWFHCSRRDGTGYNVTFPARQYSVNGERRAFALLRPVVDAAAQDRVRDTILEAYAAFEPEVARAS